MSAKSYKSQIIKDELCELNVKFLEQCKILRNHMSYVDNIHTSRVYHISFSTDFRQCEPARWHQLTLVIRSSPEPFAVEMLWENNSYGTTRVQFTQECLILECTKNSWHSSPVWECEFGELYSHMIKYIRAQAPDKVTENIITLDHIENSLTMYRYF